MALYGFTDNPVADANRHDAECERAASKLPRCDYCKKRIDDDEYYDIYGEIVCYECLNKHFRKWTDEYNN
jgi:hypothetical protein